MRTGDLLEVIRPTPEGAGVQTHVPVQLQGWQPGPLCCLRSEGLLLARQKHV